MFLTGMLNNFSGIPGASPHLCRVASSLAWFRHQVNKTLIWRLVAARRGGEWADAGHEQRRGVPGAVERVEGGWRQAQWWGMRGSHYKKIAVSVISERKSTNLKGGGTLILKKRTSRFSIFSGCSVLGWRTGDCHWWLGRGAVDGSGTGGAWISST